MSESRHIPIQIRCILWGRAAGRCEFSGCNRLVSYHSKTKETANLAEAAHIIGFSEDGPRGEGDISEELAKDVLNLMLLCKECHKIIDTNKHKYPVELLRKMKETHEHRIVTVTGIDVDRQSHILLYGANVGEHNSPVSYKKAACAMLPEWYPADTTPISLGMVNSSFQDKNVDFWRIESVHLHNMVAQQVRPRLANGSIEHLSIFSFAPQPLLMLLGFLLSDIPAAEVYQLHREPPNWKWQDHHPDGFEYVVQEPTEVKGPPALVLALSATVTDDRVNAILGDGATIWRVTVAEPHNDFLKSRQQLQRFRETIRPLMNRIKTRHSETAVLHVFLAAPVAIALDMGRVIMPKADLVLRIYDEHKSLGGFVHALDLDAGSRLKRGAQRPMRNGNENSVAF